ncbi:hypothetical protein [Paracoccus aminophilus]|uniref:Uncharacterized protein n=1 Tax=Paracoccus aminophilus JCM 7686 TaxID=1367847 RepID=S5XSV6_PARAH|nr:hypothetical protein [Paracoccus aminophilus]AGT10534.1 hypothetical protein JCM7686_1990 [Paracoccus aminophilus JCM 7686]
MDRKDQLRNVAFGGAWSEQIAGREELIRAIETLHTAAARTAGLDVRVDAGVNVALWIACKDHPKGDMLRIAWDKGAAIPVAGLRQQELRRVARLIEEAHRGRVR